MILYTERLLLEPITLPMVEAVMQGDRARVEQLANAGFPAEWPGAALIERAFCASLEAIRQDPETRLWGDRLMISRDGQRRIVGHRRPGDRRQRHGVRGDWRRHLRPRGESLCELRGGPHAEGIVRAIGT